MRTAAVLSFRQTTDPVRLYDISALSMPHTITHSQTSLSLRALFPRASFVGCADLLVADATNRSGDCRPGMLFAALPGTKHDGTSFATDAVGRGASAVLTDRPLADISVPQCVVPNVRAAYARLCAVLMGCPSRRLKSIGVTGTNGKTTVTWLIRSILNAAGHRCGMLGTIEYSDGWNREPATLTTPDSRTLQHDLAGMLERRTQFAAMEFSSHALDQDRAAGTEIDVAVLTNLTQDHFDYHRNFDAYRAAKMRIVELIKSHGLLSLNADDEAVRTIRNQAGVAAEICTFGFSDDADYRAEILSETSHGTRFLLHVAQESLELRTPLIGRHNVANCLAAAAAVSHFGLTLDEIAVGIASLESVPGRMERVGTGQPYEAFVDYAHTDDALQHSLQTLKSITSGRVICVFGAGGDRDAMKRPLLGRAALAADVCFVTSDNPRSESPDQIIENILAGMPVGQTNVHVEPDRQQAIQQAVRLAQPGDAILVAGKGHECEQIIGERRIPFDDRAVLRRLIDERYHAVTNHPERLPA